MASAAKTPRLLLPQMVAGEKPERTDFTDAFLAIEGHVSNGWLAAPETWLYDTNNGQIAIFSNVAANYYPGMRVRLTQSATVKHFIIMDVPTWSGGYTRFPIYGGTDTLANAAITAVSTSTAKAPYGFPLDPARWTVTTSDTAQRYQSAPTNAVWYNVGTLSIAIPIGAWRVLYEVVMQNIVAAAGVTVANVTLSTANNSESDADFTAMNASYGAGANGGTWGTIHREKNLLLAAPTTYYLNGRANDTNCGYLEFRGDYGKTIIRAICAFL